MIDDRLQHGRVKELLCIGERAPRHAGQPEQASGSRVIEDVLDRSQAVNGGVEEGDQMRYDDMIVVQDPVAVRVSLAQVLQLLFEQPNEPASDNLAFAEFDGIGLRGLFLAPGHADSRAHPRRGRKFG